MIRLAITKLDLGGRCKYCIYVFVDLYSVRLVNWVEMSKRTNA